MKIRSILTTAAMALAAATSCGAKLPKYTNPTPGEFPILGWYSIPDSASTPERYSEMREAGFNLSFSHLYSEAQLERALKAAEGSGVKLVLSVGMTGNPGEVVIHLKDHPQTGAWFLRDEPSVSDFADLAAMRDRVYEADSTHLVYLNLFPMWVDMDALGAQSYDDYVQRFIDAIRLPMVSYDLYPVHTDGEGKTVLSPGLFQNLETISKMSRDNGCPFWAFCLSTAHTPYPIPRDSHIRVEAFSALAYGAQCIQYFTYWEPVTTTWNFHNSPIDQTGQRTDVYYLIRDINREIQALAPIFLGCEVYDVSHTGDVTPPDTKPLATLPAPFTSLMASGEGVLVSHLKGGDGNEYLMVVNRDIDHAQRVDTAFKGAVRMVNPDGSLRHATESEYVRPGGYLLYRLS
ncbi:MAG: hypothetical protein HDS68_07280 [Bacteroidales bacterium]|nr:hypothetical protein [Bacteroidales bacterium]